MPDKMIAVTMGFGDDERGNYGVLKYAFTEARKCSNQICAYKHQTDHGDSGGPLVFCYHGLSDCVQIGVSTSSSAGTDYYVSTNVQRFYIANALKNKDFTNIRGDAARYKPSSILFTFGPQFFTIIFILR